MQRLRIFHADIKDGGYAFSHAVRRDIGCCDQPHTFKIHSQISSAMLMIRDRRAVCSVSQG